MKTKKVLFFASFLCFFLIFSPVSLAKEEQSVSIDEIDFHTGIKSTLEKKKNFLPDSIGESNTTNKRMTVTATAYTAYCDGCTGVTYTGINLISNPNQKVIAVDPNVIPLGSKVYVEGYGTAIAGDIGSAIKGNRIDIFIPSETEALKFGVQKLNITILS